MPNIEFTILGNALDSIDRTIELLAWKEIADPSSRLKQAILQVSHAIELLLKERLSHVHPSLIWEDVDKYPKLDARTVGVDKAINRLRKIGAVAISEADEELIKSIRNTRNAIEHFKWETSRREAHRIVGEALSFAVHFARIELKTDIGYRFRDDDTWDQLLAAQASFAKAHGERLGKEMTAEGKPVQECSYCGRFTQDLLTGSCELCGHWECLDEIE